MATCRFCKNHERQDRKLVKYGTRHYAHHDCYLKAGKPLSELHDWQIVSFPYRLLKEHDLISEAEEAQTRIDIDRLTAVGDRFLESINPASGHA